MKRKARSSQPIDPEDAAQSALPKAPPAVEPNHPVLLAVAGYLHGNDVGYAVLSDGDGLMFGMNDSGLTYSTIVNVFADKRMLRFAARLPLSVPAFKRRAAALLLARLNYGNLIGGWQMDEKDGEVVYVSTHLFGGNIPDDRELRILIAITVGAMGREGPQILKSIQKSSVKRLQLPPPGSN